MRVTRPLSVLVHARLRVRDYLCICLFFHFCGFFRLYACLYLNGLYSR